MCRITIHQYILNGDFNTDKTPLVIIRLLTVASTEIFSVMIINSNLPKKCKMQQLYVRYNHNKQELAVV